MGTLLGFIILMMPFILIFSLVLVFKWDSKQKQALNTVSARNRVLETQLQFATDTLEIEATNGNANARNALDYIHTVQETHDKKRELEL